MHKVGFTLIELLIVLALLGLLAVGILAAIDPLEQFKKGRDNGQRNVVQELFNSFSRYYSIQEEYPWGTTSLTSAIPLDDPQAGQVISLIIDSGELKANFLDNVNSPESIYYWGKDNNTGIEHSVCFQPISKSIRTDPNTKYNNMAVTQAEGVCMGNTNTCYWCLR